MPTYPPLLQATFDAPDDVLLERLAALLDDGADPNAASAHGETPLSVCLARRRVDAMSLLLDRGADPAPLGWSALHRAVALESLDAVKELTPTSDLSARDARKFTPFVLAAFLGDVEKAAYLKPLCADEAFFGAHDNASALVIAAAAGAADMVAWLLVEGFDPTATSSFGRSALSCAYDSPAIVAMLLDRGDGDTSLGRDVEKLAEATSHPGVARVLLERGLDPSRLSPRALHALTGANLIPKRTLTKEVFEDQRTRRFGASNPERVDLDYWSEAIRDPSLGGYGGRSRFGVPADDNAPVWCFERFGMSATQLPDGRWVLIAGEHEDYYDPDFCIYSDVMVFDGAGGLEHYIYPQETFAPTDFHTATLFDDAIIIIGNLGYMTERRPEETPVYRLDLRDFSIQTPPSTGETPGWISNHRARRIGDAIEISGGRVWNGRELTPNASRFAYEPVSGRWLRLA